MKVSIKTLVHVAVFIALDFVLTRFLAINTPIMRIGFGFAPVAVCAMLYGPVWAAVAAGAADVLGAILVPTGAFFPGFTLSAILTGILFGVCLHRRGAALPGVAVAVGVNCLGISLLLGTYWLTLITGSPFLALLPTRLVQNLIMIPVQLVVLRLLHRPVMWVASRQPAG